MSAKRNRTATLATALCLAVLIGCGDEDGSPSTDDAGAGTKDASSPMPEDGGRTGDGGSSQTRDAAAGPPDAFVTDTGVPDAGAGPTDSGADGGDAGPLDPDFDDDGISDVEEGRDEGRDSDGDGDDDYQDSDSDDDCRSDAIEAGDADIDTSPVDSDLDGSPDARDLDSDGDHVLDELEDADCDGALDGGETSSLLADSDADGATDLIELTLGTDPASPSDNPAANGDLTFLMPHQAAPTPAQGGGELSTEVSRLDVFILIDTTGSMLGEINNLKSAFATVLGAITNVVADVAVGVGGYDDFADANTCYGIIANDKPFYLLHRVMTAESADGQSSLQTALDTLTTHSGQDLPESGWQALYQTAVGSSLSYNGITVPAFNPATAPPASIPAGERTGTLGGAGFRQGALRTVVMVTDASSHNSTAYGSDPAYGGTENLYGYSTCPAVPVAVTKTQAIDALIALGARVIGVVSGGGSVDAKPDLTTAVRATRAIVPPSAWPNRPAGCALAQCCTGVNGSGVATDANGKCPLAYDLASTGAGLGTAFVDGISGLAQSGHTDVQAAVLDVDTGDAVDPASAFVDKVATHTASGSSCEGFTTLDHDFDGTPDRFVDLEFGVPACFDVLVKTNATVAETSTTQVFEAALAASGSADEALGTRRVYFVVPPAVDTL